VTLHHLTLRGDGGPYIPRLAPQVASLEFHFYLIYVVKTSRAGASLACTEPFSFLAGKGGKASHEGGAKDINILSRLHHGFAYLFLMIFNFHQLGNKIKIDQYFADDLKHSD
jgi:hypothetical protein